jgi:hypothetical protein
MKTHDDGTAHLREGEGEGKRDGEERRRLATAVLALHRGAGGELRWRPRQERRGRKDRAVMATERRPAQGAREPGRKASPPPS